MCYGKCLIPNRSRTLSQRSSSGERTAHSCSPTTNSKPASGVESAHRYGFQISNLKSQRTGKLRHAAHRIGFTCPTNICKGDADQDRFRREISYNRRQGSPANVKCVWKCARVICRCGGGVLRDDVVMRSNGNRKRDSSTAGASHQHRRYRRFCCGGLGGGFDRNSVKNVKEFKTTDFADFTDEHTAAHPCDPRNPWSNTMIENQSAFFNSISPWQGSSTATEVPVLERFAVERKSVSGSLYLGHFCPSPSPIGIAPANDCRSTIRIFKAMSFG